MAKKQRWTTILSLCRQKDKVSVHELVEILNVSEATVRRDLQQMEDLHIISRYHGGASINMIQSNIPSLLMKSAINENAKTKVARTAARLIKDNQVIYIDAGSVTFKLLDFITAKNITVVTPGIPQIEKLIDKGIHTIVLGGSIRRASATITGMQTLKQLEDLYFDVAFIGVNGIHEKFGATTANEQEAEVKKKAIAHSTIAYLLADNSKFNKLYSTKFANLDDGIVISDDITGFNRELLRYLLINGETNVSKES